MMYNKLLYATSVMSYGLARKLPVLFDAKLETKNYNYELHKYEKTTVPMLFTSKVAIAGICSLSSIYFWPWFVYNDLCQFEIYKKGYTIVDYTGKRELTKVMDYLLF